MTPICVVDANNNSERLATLYQYSHCTRSKDLGTSRVEEKRRESKRNHEVTAAQQQLGREEELVVNLLGIS